MNDSDSPSNSEVSRWEPQRDNITQLLQAWSQGKEGAAERLFDSVYPQLRRLTKARLLAEPIGVAGLETTDIVHDSYLRLVDQTRSNWRCRAHFFAVAARIVRRVLVDHARHRTRSKRGAGAIHLSINDLELGNNTPGSDAPGLDILALDQALGKLQVISPKAARIVELRFFSGLSIQETAAFMELGRATVMRNWRFGRTFLERELVAP